MHYQLRNLALIYVHRPLYGQLLIPQKIIILVISRFRVALFRVMQRPINMTKQRTTTQERLVLAHLKDLLSLGFDGILLVRPTAGVFKAHVKSFSRPFLHAALQIFISHEEYELCLVLKEMIDEQTWKQVEQPVKPHHIPQVFSMLDQT